MPRYESFERFDLQVGMWGMVVMGEWMGQGGGCGYLSDGSGGTRRNTI